MVAARHQSNRPPMRFFRNGGNTVSIASHRIALCCASVLIYVSASPVAPVLAQQVQTAGEVQIIDEIYVTGSRIGRSQFEYASPIDVFDSSDLAASGATSLDEFLQEVPAFTGFTYSTTTNNGNNGVKMVDLRGLGVKRTLVLINGRRQVGSFIGGQSEIGAVDLNTIPKYMVERIEVLKDGASTTYGSDALGGVVNIITRSRYEGAEISAELGYATEDWDAKNIGVNAIIGTTSDRGWVTIGGGYMEQEEIVQAARDWAKDELFAVFDADTNTFVNEVGGSSNSRTIRSHADLTAALEAAGAPSSGSWTVDNGLVRPLDASTDLYNFAPVNALVTPNETWSLGGHGEYLITDNSPLGTINFFGEAGYTKRTSGQRLAPDASFNVIDDFNCDSTLFTDDRCANDWVPASNPFNPFGDNANNPWGVSGFGARVNRRFEESGGRRFLQEVDTFRLVAGFNGDLNVAQRIGWEIAYIFADNQESQETKFYHRFDRWRIIVDPNLCSQDPACVAATGPENAFNPYQEFGGMTDAEIGYLSVGSLKDIVKNRLESFQFNLNAEFGELPGGPVGWAAGYERRRESADYSPDEFSAEGLTTSGANDPLGGNFTVGEIYGEVRLPLLSGLTFAESLDVDASVRYSDYNTTAGDTTNYRFGVDWAINEFVRLRSTISTGFRAPNIVELFGGNQSNSPLVEDPCEFYNRRTKRVNDNVIANCKADGLPEDFEYGFQTQAVFTQLAGAPLEPEESDNLTFGVVISPSFLPNLIASVDYWQIEVDGYIGMPDYSALLFACYSSVDKMGEACTLFTDGNPRAGDGLTANASVGLLNLGKLNTSGIDFAIDYATEVAWGPIETMDLALSGTFLNEREEVFPFAGTTDYVGLATNQEVYPEWRWYSTVGVGGGDWQVQWKMRYYGESDDFYREPALTNDAVAEDIMYHDLKAVYTWNNITLNIGIDNLTDEEPARWHSALSAETSGGYYDVFGRRAWGRFTYAF
jgi:iron complex outermembrane receptor protein